MVCRAVKSVVVLVLVMNGVVALCPGSQSCRWCSSGSQKIGQSFVLLNEHINGMWNGCGVVWQWWVGWWVCGM